MLKRVQKEVKDLLVEGHSYGLTLAALSPGLWDRLAGAGIELSTVQRLEETGPTVVVHAFVSGQSASPLEGGRWVVRVQYSEDYPFKPCRCQLLTTFWHPDVALPDGALNPEEYDDSVLHHRLSEARAAAAEEPDRVVTVEEARGAESCCVTCFSLSGEMLAALDLDPTDQISTLRLSLAEQVGKDQLKLKLTNRNGSLLADAVEIQDINSYSEPTMQSDSSESKCHQVKLHFQSFSGDQYELLAFSSDSVATLKTRLSNLVGGAEHARYVCDKRSLHDDETVAGLGFSDGTVIHFVPQLYAAPCGPFTVMEGLRCSACTSTFDESWSPANTTLNMLRRVREWMHEYRKMHQDMKRYAGRKNRQLPGWSPWVFEETKVRNKFAAVLLAEDKIEEYEEYLAKFKRLYCPAPGFGTLGDASATLDGAG